MTLKHPSEDPFNTFVKVLFCAVMAFILLMMVGCKTAVPAVNKTVEKMLEQRTDSAKITIVNKEVLDSLIIQVAKIGTQKPECDSIVQASLDQVLKQLNSRKKSGSNEMGVYYDTIHKTIVSYIKTAETKSESSSLKSKTTDTKTDIQKEVVTVEVQFIPWWVKVLAWIGAIAVIYCTYRITRIFLV